MSPHPSFPRETKLDMSAFPGAESMDPFELASDDMRDVSANIRDLLGVDHPVLSTVAKYGQSNHALSIHT